MIHSLINGTTTQAKVKVGLEMRVVELSKWGKNANLNRLHRIKVCKVGGRMIAGRLIKRRIVGECKIGGAHNRRGRVRG